MNIKKAFYKRPLFYASFIVILIGISGAWSNIESKQAYARGKDVMAEVVEKPSSCEQLGKTSFIKIKYKNKIYIRSVSYGYCDRLGESVIKVRIDEKSNSVFFIDEKIGDQIGSSFLILIAGIIIAFIGWKQK